MERPSYLYKFMFDWDVMDVVLEGKSTLDSRFFIAPISSDDQVNDFLVGYGLDPNDPVTRAELFGNFQEALQFIKRYFLKEGNSDGLDLKIPNAIYMISEVSDLFKMATKHQGDKEREERLWAEIILKIMHTILHVDKDLRTGYFKTVQTQILDRYYKYLHRDEKDILYLGIGKDDFSIPLVNFESKSKKGRDSVIIKLLHKAENTAEELFDRIGIRFVTQNRFDTLRVVKFLLENSIVIPHNIKPSRTLNSLINLENFKHRHKDIIKKILRNDLDEASAILEFEKAVLDSLPDPTKDARNVHSSSEYRSIQFTTRQLIKYRNPFLTEFNKVRKLAKTEEESELSKKILALDTSLISRDVRFFYPYEVQIVDEETHMQNTEGEASHQDYKKAQTKSAMNRIFKRLLDFKGITA